MRIAGLICNYTCRTSCNKGERYRLVRLVKEISFWCGKLVQSIRLDANAPKGRLEEVTKACDVLFSKPNL